MQRGLPLKVVLCLSAGIVYFVGLAQDNVGIGTNTPDASAVLDVVSTDKGILVPRMSFVGSPAIASPADGLIVYNTSDQCFWYYNGTTTLWMQLCAGVSGPTGPQGIPGPTGPTGPTQTAWWVDGNAGTDPATNFLGTTDTQDLVLRTDNVERMRIRTGPQGNVGIGISTPINKLDINGRVAIGSTYAGIGAPFSGLIIEGDVGIGTSSPGNKLEVVDASSSGTAMHITQSGVGLNTQGLEISVNGGSSNSYGINIDVQNATGAFNTGIYTSSGGNGGAFETTGGWFVGNGASNTTSGLRGVGQGTGVNNYGGRFTASGTATTSYAVFGSVVGSGTDAYAGYFRSSGAAITNYGGYFEATGATNNHAIVVPYLGGNVGIFTLTPATPLHVKTNDTDQAIRIEEPAGDTEFWDIYLNPLGDLNFQDDDGIIKITFEDGGQVGIGTSTPSAALQINGSTGYNQLNLTTAYTPVSNGDGNGSIGDIAWDDDFFYVKTAAGWKRATLDGGF